MFCNRCGEYYTTRDFDAAGHIRATQHMKVITDGNICPVCMHSFKIWLKTGRKEYTVQEDESTLLPLVDEDGHFRHDPRYDSTVEELCLILDTVQIPYEKEEYFGGWVVGVPSLAQGERVATAILHNGSYGHEKKLLEVYDNSGEVKVWLTATEAAVALRDALETNA